MWPPALWGFTVRMDLATCMQISTYQQIFAVPLVRNRPSPYRKLFKSQRHRLEQQFTPHCVLVLRAWSFTRRTKATLRVLLVCLACCLGVEIWACAINIRSLSYYSPLISTQPKLPGCFQSRPLPRSTFTVSVPPFTSYL